MGMERKPPRLEPEPRGDMTPARLDEIQGRVRLPTAALAELAGYSVGAVRKWRDGRVGVPARVAAWLEALEAHWLANPPPTRGGGGPQPEGC